MAKIKLREIRDDFYDSSSVLSSINRQIAFAGIGIVWIFTTAKDSIITIDKNLYISVLLLAISLLCDLLQYLYKTIMLNYIHGKEEKRIDKENEANNKTSKDVLEQYVEYSASNNIVTWIFFSFKIIATIIGYLVIGLYIMNKISVI